MRLESRIDPYGYDYNVTRVVGSGSSMGNWTEITPSDSDVFTNPCGLYVLEEGVVSFRNAENGEVFTSSVAIPSGTFLPCIADQVLTGTTATVVGIHSGVLIEA